MASSTIAHRSNGTLTAEQTDLVKRQICRPKNRQATDDELAMFIGQCERTGLDPFARQIYAVFRWDKNATNALDPRKKGDEKMGIQVSIDGFRLVAERTERYLGQAGPFWCGEDGEWTDVWLRPGPPKAAKVIVRKVLAGQVGETPAVALFSEYAVDSPFWKSKPALMIAKCAEALALRKAFPQELSGLYTAEEMGQADAPPTDAAQIEAPPEVVTPDAVEHPPESKPNGLTQVEARALFDRAKEVGVNGQRLSMYLTQLGVEHEPIKNIGTAVTALRLLSPAQAVELDGWLADQAEVPAPQGTEVPS